MTGHRQQQQSYSGLCSPRQSYSTHLWNDSWVQTFQFLTKNVYKKNGKNEPFFDKRTYPSSYDKGQNTDKSKRWEDHNREG